MKNRIYLGNFKFQKSSLLRLFNTKSKYIIYKNN